MVMIKSIYTLSINIKNKRKEIIPAAVITQKKTVNYFEARRIKRKKKSLPPSSHENKEKTRTHQDNDIQIRCQFLFFLSSRIG